MTLDINYLGIHGIYKIEYMNSYCNFFNNKYVLLK